MRVDYYGTPTPLKQMVKLSIPEPTMIVAQPFDPSILPDIEKAIISSDLGLNPSNDGKLIRIPVPALTEERRKHHVHAKKTEWNRAESNPDDYRSQKPPGNRER